MSSPDGDPISVTIGIRPARWHQFEGTGAPEPSQALRNV